MRNLVTRLEELEARHRTELQLVVNVENTMKMLLSRHPPWLDRMKKHGHPRQWPEDAGDFAIANDLYCELLGLRAGKRALIREPWNMCLPRDKRRQLEYLKSFHGPDSDRDYAAGLAELIAMRPRWIELERKYGPPQKWPENRGRWRKNEHPHVITFHLAEEWRREWERYCDQIAPGLGWFLIRLERAPRAPDPPYPYESPRGVA